MSRQQRLAVLTGAALVAVGLVLGFVPVTAGNDVASIDCGSAFLGDSFKGDQFCADALNTRTTLTAVVLVAGLVIGIGGWVLYRRPADTPE